MEIKLIGLGKMGINLGKNLIRNGYTVSAFDKSTQAMAMAKTHKIKIFASITQLIQSSREHIYYVMVPHGKAIEEVLNCLLDLLPEKSYVIDGGNSKYTKTIKRYHMFKQKNINFIDIGTSGGQEAAEFGLCIMAGGENAAIKHVEQIFNDISVSGGYEHVGPPGSGHFVKMVHNGIEYGMMQAISEGFELLSKIDSFPKLNLEQIARVWKNGSVINSWLIELTEQIFHENPKLKNIHSVVGSSGEGLWAIQDALRLGIPAPVLYASVNTRQSSMQSQSHSRKLLSAMRNKFGGHKLVNKTK